MPATVVIGGQWGDEGKGRVVDLLARDATRHRPLLGRQQRRPHDHQRPRPLRSAPRARPASSTRTRPASSATASPSTPSVLLEEIDSLEARGVSTQRLFVSDRAHVVMPYHPMIDQLDEKLRGAAAIGTTGRGIGPCFADKVARLGIRMGDLVDPRGLPRAPLLRPALQERGAHAPLRRRAARPSTRSTTSYSEYAARLAPRVCDTSVIARDALARGENILLEGAQGALLDLDGGTYDYVTSSVPSSTSAGAAIGIGIGPADITKVVGVYKAYMTRVGNGPMPTELLDETGNILRTPGPAARRSAPRPAGRAAPAGSTPSPRATAPRSTASPPSPSPASTCSTPSRRSRSAPATRSTASRSTRRRPASPPSTAPSRIYEELPGWQADSTDARTLRGPAAERPALRAAHRRAHRQADRDRLRRPGARAGHHRRPRRSSSRRSRAASARPHRAPPRRMKPMTAGRPGLPAPRPQARHRRHQPGPALRRHRPSLRLRRATTSGRCSTSPA